MSIEKPPQPFPEEIKKAEEAMTAKQKEKSREREATYEAGYKEKNKEIIDDSIKLIEVLFDKIGDGCIVCDTKPEDKSQFIKELLEKLSFLNISKEELNEEMGLNIKKAGRSIYNFGENFDINSIQDCFNRKDIVNAIKNIISKRN